MKSLILAAIACLLVLGACKKDIQNKEAVRQGIMNYLSKRTDLGNMDVSISSVSFRQNEADATVHFQAKNSNAPGTGMDLSYVLERKGNEWVVKGKGASGGAPHGGMGQNPHGGGMPPEGMPGGALPPGHPTVPNPPSGGHTPPPGPGK